MAASNHFQQQRRMQRTALALLLAAITLALNGCATPEGKLTYYLPKAETVIKVTQTLTCNAKGDSLVQVVDVSSATAYSSDLAAPVEIRPKSMDGIVANADIAFAFTNDGRLSGVNVTTVGQGGEVVKDILAVAKAAAVFGASADDPSFDVTKACGIIAEYSAKPAADDKKPDAKDDKKPEAKDDKKKAGAANVAAAAASSPATGAVTLTYEGKLAYKRSTVQGKLVDLADSNPQKIPISANSASLWFRLTKFIPGLEFNAYVVEAKKLPTPYWSGADTTVTIQLNSVANAIVEVKGLKGNLSDEKALSTFWRGEVPVPLTSKADLVAIPIPSAAVFGTRKFSLALTDYGSISKLQYSATGGVTEAAGAFTAFGNAWAANGKAPSVAQQAEAAKADGDLIYQQQRKALCLAKPESCPK